MEYELTNGERVNLYGNTHTAKFLLFVYPKLGVNFVGQVPHMTLTPEVGKLVAIRKRLLENADRMAAIERAKRELMEEFGSHDEWADDFDDDIPF